MSENLDQQACRVTAGARALFKRLLACLDARIQARHIVNFVSHAPIQVNQKADRSVLLAGTLPKNRLEERPNRFNAMIDPTIGIEIPSQLRSVLERVVFDSWFQKEIEWIVRG